MENIGSKVIIPFEVVEKHYEWWLESFVKDFKSCVYVLLDNRYIHIRENANFPKFTSLIDFWRNRWVNVFKMENWEMVWDELCFVDENWEVPNYKCNWI